MKLDGTVRPWVSLRERAEWVKDWTKSTSAGDGHGLGWCLDVSPSQGPFAEVETTLGAHLCLDGGGGAKSLWSVVFLLSFVTEFLHGVSRFLKVDKVMGNLERPSEGSRIGVRGRRMALSGRSPAGKCQVVLGGIHLRSPCPPRFPLRPGC